VALKKENGYEKGIFPANDQGIHELNRPSNKRAHEARSQSPFSEGVGFEAHLSDGTDLAR